MDKFRLRYPEFNDVPDPVVAMAIDDAEMELCQKAWGKYYERGIAALAAHTLWLKGYLGDIDEETGLPDSDGEARRAVASHTAGSLSISYAGTAKDGFGNGNTYGFEDSVYGREYLRLMNLVSPRWVVIR